MATKEELDLARVKEMWTKYKTLSKTYGGFRLRTLIYDHARQEKEPKGQEWRLFNGWMVATDAKAAQKGSLKWDYGCCIYEERNLTEDETRKFLEALVTDRKCKLSGKEIVLPDAATFNSQGYASVPYWKKQVPFPHSHYSIQLSNSVWNNPEVLLGKDLPTYPDMASLANDKFGSDIHSGSNKGELLVFLPQYVALIESPEFGIRRVSVRVRVNQPGKSGFVLKLWGRKGEEHFQDELPVGKGKITFRLPVHPDEVMLCLVEADSGALIHHWGGKLNSGVPSEESLSRPSDWLNRIRQGESQTTEFKHCPVIEGKPTESYSKRLETHPVGKSLVAFSNSEGGTLIIGVDKEGNPYDVDDPAEVKDKVSNIAATLCVPALHPKQKVVTIEGKKVLAVTVEAGRRLRTFKGNVYIRRTGTSRPATPDEIEDLFDGGRPQVGPFGKAGARFHR